MWPGPLCTDATDTAASVAETHSAVIVFLGDRAYKAKKPVDLGFLDFTTVAARRHACERELHLNRRLAPDVYLGLADVVADGDGPCDTVLVMRRLPAERRLSACLARGEDVSDALRRIARQVAVLHGLTPSGPSLEHVARRDAVRSNWEDGFALIAGLPEGIVDPEPEARIEALARRFLDGREHLFDRRIATGHVRDGHGDLLCEDVFLLEDGPRVLDCLDFDDELRWGDVLLDVGFLAMDLERLGHPDAAADLLRHYREFSGDAWSTNLLHHYVAYRAHVRAKVTALRVAQSGDGREEVARLQALCLRHLELARVRLVVVGGLPGTGKSTVAAGLGAALDAVVLRSDEVRHDLSPPTGGRYTPDAVDRTYRRMLDQAAELLAAGESVVLDATWAAAEHRELARQVATEHLADLTELRCEAPTDVCLARIERRAAAGDDPSEATADVARSMAARFEAWPESTRLDTAPPVDDVARAAADAVLGD